MGHRNAREAFSSEIPTANMANVDNFCFACFALHVRVTFQIRLKMEKRIEELVCNFL